MRSSLFIGGSYDGCWIDVDEAQNEIEFIPKDDADHEEFPHEKIHDSIKAMGVDRYRRYDHEERAIAPPLYFHSSIAKELVVYTLMREYLNIPFETESGIMKIAR